jgi:hypothetical protein
MPARPDPFTNDDDQNPNEDSGKLSNSFLNAAIVILGAAVLTVSAPLTAVAAGVTGRLKRDHPGSKLVPFE